MLPFFLSTVVSLKSERRRVTRIWADKTLTSDSWNIASVSSSGNRVLMSPAMDERPRDCARSVNWPSERFRRSRQLLLNDDHFTSQVREVNIDLFKKTIAPVLKVAGRSKSQGDQIIIVGGSTRIPKIRVCFRNISAAKS
jgi:hypothetical protein